MRFIIQRDGDELALNFCIPSKKYEYTQLFQMLRISQRVLVTPDDYRLFPTTKVPIGVSPRNVISRPSRTPKEPKQSPKPLPRSPKSLVFSDMSPRLSNIQIV